MTDDEKAEAEAIAAVSGAGGYVTVSERIGDDRPGGLRWSAETTLPLGFIQVDGKDPRNLAEDDELFDVDEIDGYGATRAEALLDLVKNLSRVTYAHLSNAEWDEAANRPVWSHVDVAWNGQTLAPIGGTS